MRANNFTEADLPRLMDFLHRRGVKGYVTFNILVFENEMPQAEQYVRTMIAVFLMTALCRSGSETILERSSRQRMRETVSNVSPR